MKPGPRASDWLLLVVCLLFTAMGIFLLAVEAGGRGPIACVAFFGFGVAVATWLIVQKMQMAKSLDVTRVEIAGSVPIPVKRGTRQVGGAALLAMGSVMVWSGGPIGVLFQFTSAIVAGAGALVLVLVALGYAAHQTLTFEPAGLRFGGVGKRGASFFVGWGNFAKVDLIEYHSNPAVRIWVRDAARLLEGARGVDANDIARVLGKNRTWTGCDLFLLPYHFGIYAVLFVKALSSYVEDPNRRGELAPRAAMEPPRGSA